LRNPTALAGAEAEGNRTVEDTVPLKEDGVQPPAIPTDLSIPRFLNSFETTRREIGEAKTTDQIKGILVRASGLAAAARTALNRELEADAKVLKLEAERKLGQLMQAQEETVGLNQGGRPKTGSTENPVSRPTLAEAGINKNLAHRARTAAAMSEAEFEKAKRTERTIVLTRTKRLPRTRSPSVKAKRRKHSTAPPELLPALPIGTRELQIRHAGLQSENEELRARIAKGLGAEITPRTAFTLLHVQAAAQTLKPEELSDDFEELMVLVLVLENFVKATRKERAASTRKAARAAKEVQAS
jgi:hypothetical protein